jgi:hypothetical protein
MNDNDNKIYGNYGSPINDKFYNLINIFYQNNFQEIIDDNNEEINKIENKINEIQIINIKLLQNIYFLEKRCKFINITSSNTTNFIIANFHNICYLLNKLILNYNNNIKKIECNKNKINDLKNLISSLKLKL